MYKAKNSKGNWVYGTNILVDKTFCNKEVNFLTSKDITGNYVFPLQPICSEIFKSTEYVDINGKELFEGDYVIGKIDWTDVDIDVCINITNTKKKALLRVVKKDNAFELQIVKVSYYEIEEIISDMIEEGCIGENSLNKKAPCVEQLENVSEMLVVGNILDTDNISLQKLYEEYILNTTSASNNEN